MEVIDKILNEWSFRCHDGIVDMNDPKKVAILNEILEEFGLLEEDIDNEILDLLDKADYKEKKKILDLLKEPTRYQTTIKKIVGSKKEKQEIKKILRNKDIPEDILDFIILRSEDRDLIPQLKNLINSITLEELGKEGQLKVNPDLMWINNLTATQSSLSLGKGEILLTIMLKDAILAKSSKYDIDYKGKEVEIKQSSISEKGIKSGGIISPLGRSSNYKNVWNEKVSGGKSFKEKYFEKKEKKEKGQKVTKYPELSTWTPIYKRYSSIADKTEFLQDLNQVLNNGGFKGEIVNSDFDNQEKFNKKIAFLATGDYLKNKTLILLNSQLEYLVLDEDKYKNAILNNPDIHANNAFLPRISYKEAPTNLEDEETEETEYSDEEPNPPKKIKEPKTINITKEDIKVTTTQGQKTVLVKTAWVNDKANEKYKKFFESTPIKTSTGAEYFKLIPSNSRDFPISNDLLEINLTEELINSFLKVLNNI
jgi:hypothetical protein